MYPDRFWDITGDRWPRKDVRNARLRECVDIIRALLRGEEVSHDGLVRVDRATVYSQPGGLITLNAPVETLRRMTGAYRDAGRRGDLALQVHLSWAPDEGEAD